MKRRRPYHPGGSRMPLRSSRYYAGLEQADYDLRAKQAAERAAAGKTESDPAPAHDEPTNQPE